MELQGFENKARPIGVLGVKISQGGEVIAHKTWDEECRRNVYSASKSVTSCAVGFAVQEGLLSLEERLVDAFAQDLPETVSENLERATVRDLLTMCLGQARGELMGAQRPLYQERDWVKLALSFPFTDAPNTKFVYNNVGPYLAGMLVQRRSGCDLVSYLTPRLFEHLGITRPTWECPWLLVCSSAWASSWLPSPRPRKLFPTHSSGRESPWSTAAPASAPPSHRVKISPCSKASKEKNHSRERG